LRAERGLARGKTTIPRAGSKAAERAAPAGVLPPFDADLPSRARRGVSRTTHDARFLPEKEEGGGLTSPAGAIERGALGPHERDRVLERVHPRRLPTAAAP
jgi:hypothetical protein